MTRTKPVSVVISSHYDGWDIEDLESALEWARIGLSPSDRRFGPPKTCWPTIEEYGERYLDSSKFTAEQIKILVALDADSAAEQAAEDKALSHWIG